MDKGQSLVYIPRTDPYTSHIRWHFEYFCIQVYCVYNAPFSALWKNHVSMLSHLSSLRSGFNVQLEGMSSCITRGHVFLCRKKHQDQGQGYAQRKALCIFANVNMKWSTGSEILTNVNVNLSDRPFIRIIMNMYDFSAPSWQFRKKLGSLGTVFQKAQLGESTGYSRRWMERASQKAAANYQIKNYRCGIPLQRIPSWTHQIPRPKIPTANS